MGESLRSIAGDGARRRKPHRAFSRLFIMGAMILSLVLVFGASSASAHNWGSWHWDRGGSAVSIYVQDQTGGCPNSGNASNDALYDIYWNPHPLYIYCTSSHTDISLWEANEPGAWYCGLAQVWSPWYGGSHIDHGHARTNTACGTGKTFKQGIHCQEFAHTLGLDHSATGDCMGLSYFSSSSGRYYFGASGPYVFDWDHQTSDLYSRYRYH